MHAQHELDKHPMQTWITTAALAACLATTLGLAEDPPLVHLLRADDLHGLIDGSVVLTPEADRRWSFSEGLAAIRLGKLHGYLDKTARRASRWSPRSSVSPMPSMTAWPVWFALAARTRRLCAVTSAATAR